MASITPETRLIDLIRRGISLHEEEPVNPDVPLEEQEGGLMDFRRNSIVIRKKKSHPIITVRITFTCVKTVDINGSIDVPKWCTSFAPRHIGDGYLQYVFDEYIKDSAKWEDGGVLYFELDNKEENLTKSYIREWLQEDSLEDGPYEGGIGDFWIVPASEFK